SCVSELSLIDLFTEYYSGPASQFFVGMVLSANFKDDQVHTSANLVPVNTHDIVRLRFWLDKVKVILPIVVCEGTVDILSWVHTFCGLTKVGLDFLLIPNFCYVALTLSLFFFGSPVW